MTRRDTTVTLRDLEQVAYDCFANHRDIANFLELINPIMECLLYSGNYGSHNNDEILGKLHALLSGKSQQ